MKLWSVLFLNIQSTFDGKPCSTLSLRRVGSIWNGVSFYNTTIRALLVDFLNFPANAPVFLLKISFKTIQDTHLIYWTLVIITDRLADRWQTQSVQKCILSNSIWNALKNKMYLFHHFFTFYLLFIYEFSLKRLWFEASLYQHIMQTNSNVFFLVSEAFTKKVALAWEIRLSVCSMLVLQS